MHINRRAFLALTATFAAGCASEESGGNAPAGVARVVDAGPAARYAADGVYPAFRHQGFFIVRREGRLLALSSICTHRRCRLDVEGDRSFYCPCHGSTFDPSGHVTEGPARRDLPVLPSTVTADGRLLVTVPPA